KAYVPSGPVVVVPITLPAASTSVTRASARGPCGARTTPRSRAPGVSSTSSPVVSAPPTSTGRARGRYPGAFTATVTAPGTRSVRENAPSAPVVPVARTSPRTSVTITVAPVTGPPSPAARTTPVRQPVPLSRMSWPTGSPFTTTVDACGWWPSAAAIRTYDPAPGASIA